MERFRYAAFIMTYERPEVLRDTIARLQNQSLPPELILIVDNSKTTRTEELLKSLDSEQLMYHKVGYNSGPAGAAKIGLQKLTSLGFDWIYWGDDDDPPRDEKVLQQLFTGVRELTANGVKLGVFGGKGGSLNKWTGRINSLSNSELRKAPYVEVGSVPGGQDMLVNSEVIKSGVLPDEKLFFGFEEFDFCLKTKAAGFSIYIDAENWLKTRQRSGFSHENYCWRGHAFGNEAQLHREFYSTRNLLEIFYHQRYYAAFSFLMLKSIAKMFFGVRHGLNYGVKIFRTEFLAIKAFFRRDFSRRDKPY